MSISTYHTYHVSSMLYVQPSNVQFNLHKSNVLRVCICVNYRCILTHRHHSVYETASMLSPIVFKRSPSCEPNWLVQMIDQPMPSGMDKRICTDS